MRGICALFVFISCLSYSQVDHWETVVYDNSSWSYLVPNASTSTSWISPSFSAASWSVGPGGFGFGDGDDNTTLPTSSISVYHRIDFNIVDVSVIVKAVFNVDYDDGVDACVADIATCEDTGRC